VTASLSLLDSRESLLGVSGEEGLSAPSLLLLVVSSVESV
jgi:hypothetical protein